VKDRVVCLLYMGTSNGRRETNLFRHTFMSLCEFGNDQPNNSDSILYLAFRTGAHQKHVGQARRGPTNRKRGRVGSMSKFSKGGFNSCKIYSGPRPFRRLLYIEVICLGPIELRSDLRNEGRANFSISGSDDSYLESVVSEKLNSVAAIHRVQNAA